MDDRAGNVIVEGEDARFQISLNNRPAWRDAIAPERDRLGDLLPGVVVVVGRCGSRALGLRRPVAIPAIAGDAKALLDVIAAGLPIIAGMRESDKPLWRGGGEPEGQASVALAMSWPRTEDLPAVNFAA